MNTVPFHFLLLAAGEVLKYDFVVTAQKIQDFIQADDAFGVRVPLGECRLALNLMADSHLLKELEKGEYVLYTTRVETTVTSSNTSNVTIGKNVRVV